MKETMLEADYLVDIGPGAGVPGGTVVAAGTPQQVMDNPASVTGRIFPGKSSYRARKAPYSDWRCVRISGASENNLKNIDVSFPIGLFAVVTGVSGSGKSSCKRRAL